MKKIKTFDWKIAKNMQNSPYLEWLFENQNKPMTEEEFVNEAIKFKSVRLGKSYKYSPSHLRSKYRKLKNNFGFFIKLTQEE